MLFSFFSIVVKRFEPGLEARASTAWSWTLSCGPWTSWTSTSLTRPSSGRGYSGRSSSSPRSTQTTFTHEVNARRYKRSVITACVLQWGQIKTRELFFYITSSKACGKESGSIQHVTQVRHVGVTCKQHTRGDFLCNFFTPTLPPQNPPSLICLLDTPRKPAPVDMRILITILHRYPIF